MIDKLTYTQARDILLNLVSPVGTERVPLERCTGRVLAEELKAAENVPAFDRSPFDGYAVRAEDTCGADAEHPVTLMITEEIPAGAVAHFPVTAGKAAKILTGAPIPEGADAIVKYEETSFTAETVTLTAPLLSGTDIIRTGEDVCKGEILARAGTVIDCGLAGCIAAQGIAEPLVYRRPLIGLISTGSELADPGTEMLPGQIYNSNRAMLTAALENIGCQPMYLGITGDSTEDIAALLRRGAAECDAVLLTGGVSVGDYDLTPAAMEQIGVEIKIHGLKLKPGMACVCGAAGNVPVCGLSGNPASAMTDFYAVIQPMLKKMTGRENVLPTEFMAELAERFGKKSRATRLLRGKLDLSSGTVKLHILGEQGNVVISSMIGCDAMAVIPAGSGAVEAGTVLKGFFI